MVCAVFVNLGKKIKINYHKNSLSKNNNIYVYSILYILYILLLCFCFNISRSGLAVKNIHCSIPCSLPSSSESRSVWTLRSSSPSRWSRTLVTHRTLIPGDATRWRTSAALSGTIHSENERRAFQNRHLAEVNALLEYQG